MQLVAMTFLITPAAPSRQADAEGAAAQEIDQPDELREVELVAVADAAVDGLLEGGGEAGGVALVDDPSRPVEAVGDVAGAVRDAGGPPAGFPREDLRRVPEERGYRKRVDAAGERDHAQA